MKNQIDKLGKVSITVDDNPWSNTKDYDRLVFVKVEETGGVYMSKRPVPSGVSIHNRYYWLKFGKEANINPDKVGEEVTGDYATNMTAPHNYTKGDIFYIDNHGETETGIITYYIALIDGNQNDRLQNSDIFAQTNIAAEALNIKISTLHKVSRTGNYNDLNNKPTNLSQFNNDTKYISVNPQSYTDNEKQVGRTNIGAISEENMQNELAGYINDAAYNSTSKEILFYHTKGSQSTVLARINASAFIKDGMVSSVVIRNNKLIITFNTDSGQSPIEINLYDIFNPNNYYTKSESDNKYHTISAFNTEIAKYYTKTQADGKFATLTLLNEYIANLANTYYNKTEIDSKISNITTELGKKVNDSALATVAKTGNYNDLINKPTNISVFTNDANYISKKELIKYATHESDITLALTGNKIHEFNYVPLTSLTITSINISSLLEDVIIFIAGANMTFTYPTPNIWFINEEPTFEEGVTYIMSIWYRYIIVGEICIE
jgi:hypothetical protein